MVNLAYLSNGHSMDTVRLLETNEGAVGTTD